MRHDAQCVWYTLCVPCTKPKTLMPRRLARNSIEPRVPTETPGTRPQLSGSAPRRPPVPFSTPGPLPVDCTHTPFERTEPPPPPPPRADPPPPSDLPRSIPNNLLALGNGAQWRAVRKRLLDPESRHRPILLSGPTGCGKTRGICDLLASLDLRVVVLDAVEAADTWQLLSWIRQSRKTKTMLRSSAVVLDDLEGFTERARTEIVRLALEPTDASFAPLVLVCTNARAPEWRRLSDAVHVVRLRAPSEHQCVEWFTTRHVWTANGSESRVGFPPGMVKRHAELLVLGDLRRIAITLEFEAHTADVGVFDSADPRVALNSFEATRRLLLRRPTMPPDEWCRHTEPRDVALIQHHAAEHVGQDDAALDRLVALLDAASSADAHRPARFEHHAVGDVVAKQVVSRVVALTSRARDVRALAPPRPPPSRPRQVQETPSDALNRCR